MSEDSNNTSEIFDDVFDRSFKAAKKPGQKTFGDRLSYLVGKFFYLTLILVFIMVIGGIGIFMVV
ncbi:MAG: hypothetical protein KAR35_07205 [Candidatus Heimdallarchaeota archaeon]|nr:hypothetical protein [Candidatus Heimdallarchaeota archaeon]MCK5049147.1 hypothetical protein [Candidatus Heimdallarchaeota archaeon]